MTDREARQRLQVEILRSNERLVCEQVQGSARSLARALDRLANDLDDHDGMVSGTGVVGWQGTAIDTGLGRLHELRNTIRLLTHEEER